MAPVVDGGFTCINYTSHKMLEQRGEKLFSCKLSSSLQSEMVRPVLFVDFMQNLRSGSSLLRTHQLWKLSKPGLDDTGTTSAVTASLDHRDSILVLNKNTLLHCSQEQMATLRQHGNVLMADPLDGKVDESILASCATCCSPLRAPSLPRFSNTSRISALSMWAIMSICGSVKSRHPLTGSGSPISVSL
jgi:hypothetical protein